MDKVWLYIKQTLKISKTNKLLQEYDNNHLKDPMLNNIPSQYQILQDFSLPTQCFILHDNVADKVISIKKNGIKKGCKKDRMVNKHFDTTCGLLSTNFVK